jgi:hypothetical protein
LLADLGWLDEGLVAEVVILSDEGLEVGKAVGVAGPAHGYEDDDSGSDADAIRRLTNLANRYQERLTFVRLKSTHAKVLIFDSTWINTSFNWLSFRGDRDQSYRMEEGTLVRGRKVVDAQHERYIAHLDQDRR